jgi:hypothetical protein
MSNVLMVTIRAFVALRGAHKLWGWVWALIPGAGSGRQAALGTACFWARARSECSNTAPESHRWEWRRYSQSLVLCNVSLFLLTIIYTSLILYYHNNTL